MNVLDLFKRKIPNTNVLPCTQELPEVVKKMRKECLKRVQNNGGPGRDIGWYYLTQKEFDDIMHHFWLTSSITEKETRYKEGMHLFGLKIKIIDRR
ncbi:MAG: hypothetical protein WBO49_04070 [Candidatus Saccharimonas sp.]